MAKIPLYQQRSRPSSDYQAASLDPRVEASVYEADIQMGEALGKIGQKMTAMKADADAADYENFALEKQAEIAELRTKALIEDGANIEDVFETVVKPKLLEVENEITQRGYSNSKRFIQRWQNDSARIALGEKEDQLQMQLADYEAKMVREANNYYKSGNFEEGDKKLATLSNYTGETKALEYMSSGRYGYLQNQILQSNDPAEITMLVANKEMTDKLTFAQQQQVMTTALGRKRTLIQDNVRPAMDAADKLLKNNMLTTTYIDQQQAEGRMPPNIAQYYRNAITLKTQQVELGLDEDTSRGDVKRIRKAKDRIDNFMNGNFKGDPLDQLDDILDLVNKADPTPLVRSKLLSPIYDAMGDPSRNGFFANTTQNPKAYSNIQSRALGEFHRQFNALTGTMPADQRDELYMDSVFLMEDFLKGMKKGYYKVDGQKIVLTTGKAQKAFGSLMYEEAQADDGEIAPFQNEINLAVAQALKEVRKFSVRMPLKPRISSINVTLDPVDEFFPER